MAQNNEGSEGMDEEFASTAKAICFAGIATKMFYNSVAPKEGEDTAMTDEIALELTKQFLRDQFAGAGMFDTDKI